MSSDGQAADLAVKYVVATILVIIALCVISVIVLVATMTEEQTRHEQVATLTGDFRRHSASTPMAYHKQQLRDAAATPSPSTRTSIDLIRRRYHQTSDPACSGDSKLCTSAKASPMDTMELDSETVAVLNCAGVNRILGSVPPAEVESHRLVLRTFDWDLDVVTQTGIMSMLRDE